MTAAFIRGKTQSRLEGKITQYFSLNLVRSSCQIVMSDASQSSLSRDTKRLRSSGYPLIESFGSFLQVCRTLPRLLFEKIQWPKLFHHLSFHSFPFRKHLISIISSNSPRTHQKLQPPKPPFRFNNTLIKF
jgi:hypothetical protein